VVGLGLLGGAALSAEEPGAGFLPVGGAAVLEASGWPSRRLLAEGLDGRLPAAASVGARPPSPRVAAGESLVPEL
jgi:hypothetical protein